MKKTGKAFLLPFFLFFSFQLAAQGPIFFAPKDTISASAQRYVAKIRVSKFRQIIGAQFVVSWDPKVLTIDSVGSFALPFSLENNFGVQDVASGLLRFAWNNESLKGVDLRDSITLFALNFKVIGLPNTMSEIKFVDAPIPKEVYDTTFSVIKAEFRNGSVLISGGQTTSTYSSDPEMLDIRGVFPNPLAEGEMINVEFFQQDGSQLSIELMDNQGRLLHRQQQYFSTGTWRLQIQADRFPVTGVYFVRLVQGNRYSTQKVFVRRVK